MDHDIEIIDEDNMVYMIPKAVTAIFDFVLRMNQNRFCKISRDCRYFCGSPAMLLGGQWVDISASSLQLSLTSVAILFTLNESSLWRR